MADRHNRIATRDGIVGKDELGEPVDVGSCLLGKFEHGSGCISRDHPVSGVEEMSGQQSATTAKLDHHALPITNRLKETQNARCDQIGVESEPEMVDQAKIAPILRCASRIHSAILADLQARGAHRDPTGPPTTATCQGPAFRGASIDDIGTPYGRV
jgi:hypothetical protein